MSRLRGTGALARAWLAEAWRAKPALFWNLAFPLIFMIGLGYIFGGGDPEQVARIVPGILTINLIAAAGNETTTRLIGWTGKLLAEHPDQRRELAEDWTLVPAAIEEILRFEAPSPVQARYVTRAVAHHGETIPAGSALLLLNGSANRDERRFQDGDRFDIHRRIDQHLSFGYGVHFCLGASLARLEARVALEELHRAIAEYAVDEARLDFVHAGNVAGFSTLPLRYRPLKSSSPKRAG